MTTSMEPCYYFDHAATTRVLPEAAQAATEAMTEAFGNPSSLYRLGTQAARAVEEHRTQVAQALGCKAEEVYFTSGGTEGDNWAIAMAVHLGRHKGKHIITTAIEHAAVVEPARPWNTRAMRSPTSPPDAQGHIQSGGSGGRPAAGHGAGVHDAGEQRGRAPSSLAEAAQLLRRKNPPPCSTPTPCRDS